MVQWEAGTRLMRHFDNRNQDVSQSRNFAVSKRSTIRIVIERSVFLVSRLLVPIAGPLPHSQDN